MKVLVVGGGIGGLTTAMMLAARGIDCSVHEQAPRHRDLGVGITLMPIAVRELAGLGLLPALLASGVPSAHLYYQTRRGQIVWDEPLGLAAGHDVPQKFLHRGHLLTLLAEAATARLPQGTAQPGQRLTAFHQTCSGGRSALCLGRRRRACRNCHPTDRGRWHPLPHPRDAAPG